MEEESNKFPVQCHRCFLRREKCSGLPTVLFLSPQVTTTTLSILVFTFTFQSVRHLHLVWRHSSDLPPVLLPLLPVRERRGDRSLHHRWECWLITQRETELYQPGPPSCVCGEKMACRGANHNHVGFQVCKSLIGWQISLLWHRSLQLKLSLIYCKLRASKTVRADECNQYWHCAISRVQMWGTCRDN